MDSASNSQKNGDSLILINFEGVDTEYALYCSFRATNNQDEYEALLVKLKITKILGIKSL